ncbi:hypothetical protein KKA33_00725 [Patescibacteria group bacterium]|nr:hypothetical protein [Patescibacteria group bacterium]
MPIHPEKLSVRPAFSATEALKGMRKNLDKPIEVITKMWGKFSELVDRLNKKYLAPLMAPLTGWLDSFADLKLGGKKEEEKKKGEDREGNEDGVEKMVKKSEGQQAEKTPEVRAELATLTGEAKMNKDVEKMLIGPRILRAVDEAIEKRVTGIHCWDWADKVYKMAGITERKTIFDSVDNFDKNTNKQACAQKEQLDNIEPGDWLFINNNNPHDPKGNHSVIFLGWADKENLIARTAGASSGTIGSPSTTKIATEADFPAPPEHPRTFPVTRIKKPVV